MGSILTLSLYGSDRLSCENVVEKVFSEVGRIERLISFFDPDSSLSRINRSANNGLTRLDPKLAWLISESLKYSRMTQGAFDVTVNPIMKLWGHRGNDAVTDSPSRQKIEETMRAVGFGKVRLDMTQLTVEFLADGLEVDLGGIGKGYGVDRSVSLMVKEGVSRALVSFGSVGYALGAPPGKRGWAIGIQDPTDQSGLTGTLILKDRAVSTSGGYQQYLTLDGSTRSHLIDPRTGRPIPRLTSGTVVCPSATEADALSTGFLILGRVDGLSLLERIEDVEGQIVTKEPDESSGVYTTSGWDHHLEYRGGRDRNRRKFLKAALLAFGFLLFGRVPLLSSISPRIKYVLKWLIPGAEYYEEQKIELTREQIKMVQEQVGKRFRNNKYLFYSGLEGDKPIGHAVILDVPGKEMPITFMVSMNPDGEVMGVEVLTYRESIGGEIRSKRFLRQFRGLTLASPIHIGQDIEAITGATISARSTAYAVRKALALLGVVFGNIETDNE